MPGEIHPPGKRIVTPNKPARIQATGNACLDTMKILLANPANRSYVVMPSLGLGYLAALLLADGHDVRILNCIKERMTHEEFEHHIQSEQYDLIGFQVYSYDLKSVHRHLASVKRVSPSSITIAGGPHPSGDPSGTLSYLDNLDFAFRGEAEIGLPMLVRQLASGKTDFGAIPGLIWRHDGGLALNPRGFVKNLDELPMPAWDLVRPECYPEAPHGAFTEKFPTAPIITSRGCPSLCTFCAGSSINGRMIRRRSVANVMDELRHLKRRGIREFHIEDENFTLSREYVTEFCDRLKDERLEMSWSLPSGVRLDTLDREMLVAMVESGCYSIAVGIEFGSDRILRLTRKGLTLKLIEEKMKLFAELPIKVTGFFLFGIPGEQIEEMERTARFSRSLPLDRAQFNIFAPLPGSFEWNRLHERGMLDKLDPARLYVHDVSYVEGDVTAKNLKRIQRLAVLRFYLRPKILCGLVMEIRSLRHLKFLFLRLIDTLVR